jgi:hypothetical protein
VIRQAGKKQILDFLDLLFQAPEVRLGNATFGMNQVFDISSTTGEIRNSELLYRMPTATMSNVPRNVSKGM